jgi:uncharacterized coiled-coil DUF342 family protein
MLLRISLIVAVLAGLGAGVVSYLQVSDKVPALKQQRDTEHEAKVTEIAEHNKTKKDLKKTQGELEQTQKELTNTQSERDKAVTRADQQNKRANELSDKLAKTTQQRDEALNDVASYKASGLTAEQVFKLVKNLKDTQSEVDALSGEKAVLLRKVAKLEHRVEELVGTNAYVLLRPDLSGKIIVVDPKWDFVVLNVGEDQGVLNNGELLVSRNGRLVGKVIVRSVQKDRSIANLLPGWKLGELVEGDDISPAHPAS